jgi:hypothetical protein
VRRRYVLTPALSVTYDADRQWDPKPVHILV